MPKVLKTNQSRKKACLASQSAALTRSKTAKALQSVQIWKRNSGAKSLGVTANVEKRKRSRKTYDQMVVLNELYKKDPTWSRETVQHLKKRLGLKTAQIYKWGYDRKKLAEMEDPPNDNLKSAALRREDTLLTDRSIRDFNRAVDEICEAFYKNHANEGLTRTLAVTGWIDSYKPCKNPQIENTGYSSTHPESYSDVSEIVPSKENINQKSQKVGDNSSGPKAHRRKEANVCANVDDGMDDNLLGQYDCFRINPMNFVSFQPIDFDQAYISTNFRNLNPSAERALEGSIDLSQDIEDELNFAWTMY